MIKMLSTSDSLLSYAIFLYYSFKFVENLIMLIAPSTNGALIAAVSITIELLKLNKNNYGYLIIIFRLEAQLHLVAALSFSYNMCMSRSTFIICLFEQQQIFVCLPISFNHSLPCANMSNFYSRM
jgi:hypothetical protein